MAVTPRVCRNASITFGGNTLAGVVDGTVTLTTETIDVSELTSVDRSFLVGIKSGTASFTVFYDQDDTSFKSLETAYAAGNAGTLVFTFHSGATYTASAYITSLSPSIAMMDICRCSVQFQLTGAVSISA
ncbi:MAG: Lambda phage tail tube protein [Candidatus Eisenbacteria bacterium]